MAPLGGVSGVERGETRYAVAFGGARRSALVLPDAVELPVVDVLFPPVAVELPDDVLFPEELPLPLPLPLDPEEAAACACWDAHLS